MFQLVALHYRSHTNWMTRHCRLPRTHLARTSMLLSSTSRTSSARPPRSSSTPCMIPIAKALTLSVVTPSASGREPRLLSLTACGLTSLTMMLLLRWSSLVRGTPGTACSSHDWSDIQQQFSCINKFYWPLFFFFCFVQVCWCCHDCAQGNLVPHVWHEPCFWPWSHRSCNVLWSHGWWPAYWSLRRHVGWMVHEGLCFCRKVTSHYHESITWYVFSHCTVEHSIHKIININSWNFRSSVTTWAWEWRLDCRTSGTARLATPSWTWRRNTRASSGRRTSSPSSRTPPSPRSATPSRSATSPSPSRSGRSSARSTPTSSSLPMPWSPGSRPGMSWTPRLLLSRTARPSRLILGACVSQDGKYPLSESVAVA